MLGFDAGASAYDRFMGRWSRLYVPALLAGTGLGVGERVLDLATGTGEAARLAAERVGPRGRVVATDISLPMLRVAATRLAGTPTTLVAADAAKLPYREHVFDVVVSQLGLMLMPDPARATAEVRRVLREGGRVGACVWSTPDRVPLVGLLAEALSRQRPALRDVLHLGFSLGDESRLGGLLAGAGLGEIRVVRETREIAFDSFEDYWSPVEGGAGRLGQAYRELAEVARQEVEAEVRAGLARFVKGGRIGFQVEALLGFAQR